MVTFLNGILFNVSRAEESRKVTQEEVQRAEKIEEIKALLESLYEIF